MRSKTAAALKSERIKELREAAQKHEDSAKALLNASHGGASEYEELLKHHNGETQLGALCASAAHFRHFLLPTVVKSQLHTLRTLIFLDGTNSMGYTLSHAKQRISQVFDRTTAVLNKEQISAGFEIAIATYRNYNSNSDMILQPSTWEAKPDSLKEFLSGIHCSGGHGNEAVEVALWHANNEHDKEPLSQVRIAAHAHCMYQTIP